MRRPTTTTKKSNLFLNLLSNVKTSGIFFFQIFVTFLENLNFKRPRLINFPFFSNKAKFRGQLAGSDAPVEMFQISEEGLDFL